MSVSKQPAGGRPDRPRAPRAGKPADATTPASEAQSLDFGPLNDQLGYRVRKVYTILFRTFSEMFADINIAFGQYSILMLVARNPGVSQMAVAEAAEVDRTTIVPILQKFTELRWVKRRRRTDDRRVYSLQITPAGQAVLDAAEPIMAVLEERLFSALTPDERGVLDKLLLKIVEQERARS